MEASADQRTDLLALSVEPRSIAPLREELERRGMLLDVAGSMCDLRTAFFSRGGHEVFIVMPDVPVSLAERAVQALRELDSDVSVVVFGSGLRHAELPGTVHRCPEFHPTSRAGIGAVLRAVELR